MQATWVTLRKIPLWAMQEYRRVASIHICASMQATKWESCNACWNAPQVYIFINDSCEHVCPARSDATRMQLASRCASCHMASKLVLQDEWNWISGIERILYQKHGIMVFKASSNIIWGFLICMQRHVARLWSNGGHVGQLLDDANIHPEKIYEAGWATARLQYAEWKWWLNRSPSLHDIWRNDARERNAPSMPIWNRASHGELPREGESCPRCNGLD